MCLGWKCLLYYELMMIFGLWWMIFCGFVRIWLWVSGSVVCLVKIFLLLVILIIFEI